MASSVSPTECGLLIVRAASANTEGRSKASSACVCSDMRPPVPVHKKQADREAFEVTRNAENLRSNCGPRSGPEVFHRTTPPPRRAGLVIPLGVALDRVATQQDFPDEPRFRGRPTETALEMPRGKGS